MNEVCCVYESNLDRVAQLLDERNTKDSVYIAFYSDAGYSNEEMEKILNSILDSTGMTQFQLVYDYYTKGLLYFINDQFEKGEHNVKFNFYYCPML